MFSSSVNDIYNDTMKQLSWASRQVTNKRGEGREQPINLRILEIWAILTRDRTLGCHHQESQFWPIVAHSYVKIVEL